MVNLIRSVFESALKTNPSLDRAFLTGCLRVSKESIFTGLNNLQIFSIMSTKFDDSFGFTQKEIDSLLECYGLENKSSDIRHWYQLTVKTALYVRPILSGALSLKKSCCETCGKLFSM